MATRAFLTPCQHALEVGRALPCPRCARGGRHAWRVRHRRGEHQEQRDEGTAAGRAVAACGQCRWHAPPPCLLLSAAGDLISPHFLVDCPSTHEPCSERTANNAAALGGGRRRAAGAGGGMPGGAAPGGSARRASGAPRVARRRGPGTARSRASRQLVDPCRLQLCGAGNNKIPVSPAVSARRRCLPCTVAHRARPLPPSPPSPSSCRAPTAAPRRSCGRTTSCCRSRWPGRTRVW
jgi:hypothetical protein